MGGKCWHSSPQGRMKPVTLFVALLLVGLAGGEDEERKGAGVKGACKNTGPKPSDKLFAKYTIPIKNKKCPCWWDMSKKICACCKGSNSMQCGWPMHRYCYKKSKMGCPGVCNNKFTLSGKGFPCYNDKSKGNNCAWCAAGGFQCYADGTILADPDTHVELQMDIMTEQYEFPFTGQGFSSSAELQALITEMGNVESECGNEQCQATFNQTEVESRHYGG